MIKHIILCLSVLFYGNILDAQFAQQWVKTFDDSLHYDNLSKAITINAAGSIIISGATNDSLGQTSELRTIKYDPSGNILWEKTYIPSYPSYYPTDIITDTNGNIYISVDFLDVSNVRIRLLKYSCNGDLIWDSEYPEVNQFSFSKILLLDESGNIYIGAQSGCWNCYPLAQNNYGEETILKFDNSGNFITEMRTGSFFTTQYIGYYSGTISDMMISGAKIYSITNLAQDSTSNLSPITYDFGISRHDTDGTRDYLKRIRRPSTDDFPIDLFLGNNDDLFITGWTKDTIANSKKRALTAKLDSAGNILYLKERGDTAWENEAMCIVADRSGNAYVAGRTFEHGTTADIELIKYDPNGNELWVQIYDSPFNNWDSPVQNSIYIDSLANIYINAYSNNGSNIDFLVVKYDSSGTLTGEYRYNGASNMDDYPVRMLANADNELFITGNSQTVNGPDYATIKLGYPSVVVGDSLCSLTGISATMNILPDFRIYPNPVSSELTLICSESILELRIFNIFGQEVYERSYKSPASIINLSSPDFPSGVYIIKGETKAKSISKSFIKL